MGGNGGGSILIMISNINYLRFVTDLSLTKFDLFVLFRLIRLVIEYSLSLLPYQHNKVDTPQVLEYYI